MTPEGLEQLKRDEGLRLKAYPDPLSGGDPWTIGYGCTGPHVKPGLVWTEQACVDELQQRVAGFEAQLDKALPWWRTLDPVRQDVIVNMAFNLGVLGLLTFRRTLGMIEAKDFADAAHAMMQSAWSRQVGKRAQRLADMMRTGRRA